MRERIGVRWLYRPLLASESLYARIVIRCFVVLRIEDMDEMWGRFLSGGFHGVLFSSFGSLRTDDLRHVRVLWPVVDLKTC